MICIENIYAKILKLENKGLLVIKRFEEMSEEYLNNIYKMIKQDIKKYDLFNKSTHNYTVFLKSKFSFIFTKYANPSENKQNSVGNRVKLRNNKRFYKINR